MFYTLNNGETIEIDIFEDENYKKYNLHVATTASTQCHIAVHILHYSCRFRNKGNIFQFESRLHIRLLRTTFFVLSALVTSGAGW